jgi:hypothetical protein|tara:strand:+ start:1448 stop:1615 length:168 start_codon:yes stop_codon:yes gene_type:complete
VELSEELLDQEDQGAVRLVALQLQLQLRQLPILAEAEAEAEDRRAVLAAMLVQDS